MAITNTPRKPLAEITADDISVILDRIPGRARPASSLRPPDPGATAPQWHHLTPAEVNMVKEFLAQLKKNQPVRITVSHKLATALIVCFNWCNPRKLRMPRVLHYAQEMKRENWVETSQGIGFSEDKTYLVDGQHRLIGQELSKKSETYTFHLLSKEAEKNIDTGAGRSLSLVTKLEPKMASAARTMNEHALNYTGPASATAMIEIVQEYKPSFDLIFGYKQFKKSTAVLGTMIYCHGQLEKHPTLQKRLEGFIKSVADGLMLTDEDPAYELREWLARTKHSTVGERREVRNRIIKACYAHLTNRKNSTIQEIELYFKKMQPEKLRVFSGYLDLDAA